MLDLVVREAHKSFERKLIAEDMGATLIKHLGADKSFDQPKNVRIRATLDLTEQARLFRGEKSQTIDSRQSVGHELARKVEGAALKQIAIDLPFGVLRQS